MQVTTELPRLSKCSEGEKNSKLCQSAEREKGGGVAETDLSQAR